MTRVSSACTQWISTRVHNNDNHGNDSDESSNGGDERESEFENLDLMSATARRPLTNTDEGERSNPDKRLGSRCID